MTERSTSKTRALFRRRFPLFPTDMTEIKGRLACDGQAIDALAERYGTPLYIYSAATMQDALKRYGRALDRCYPGAASITYAGKAFLCTALAQWVQEQRLWLDCTGASELQVAHRARVSTNRVVMHGVNKSAADLRSAMRMAGTIVVDNPSEAQRLCEIARTGTGAHPQIWLRLQPGMAVDTHHTHTQTGQLDSKFGMTPSEMQECARILRGAGLRVKGIHFHQGSNFRNPAPLKRAVSIGLDAAKAMGMRGRWHFSPGGGWGTAYNEAELPQPEVAVYVKLIADAVKKGCRERLLPLPHLHLEPGRSLVAQAGVAVYRVGTIKRRKSKTWLLVDGGLADNPRPAIYGATYTCLPVDLRERPLERTTIGGPYCESGDVLIPDVIVPRIDAGELVAIPASGAYQLSMASNYNGAGRPAVIWLERGRARLILRRETAADLTRRDLPLK